MSTHKHGPIVRLSDISNLPATMGVADAGDRFFGLGRSASYAAARRGDMPTIKMGNRLVVPVARLIALLGADD
jgi:hypothetical protein